MDFGGRVLGSVDGPFAALGGSGRPFGDLRPPWQRRRGRQPALDLTRRFRPLHNKHVETAAEKWARRLARRGNTRLLTAILFATTLVYGTTLGGHWPEVQAAAFYIPDGIARSVGFGIASVTVDGRKALTDNEVLEALEFGNGRSLPFLNVAAARQRLMKSPLVMDATIRKLYPNKLAITVVERTPFALWQRDGHLAVIAADGTAIDIASSGRFANLPLVVGLGADKAARDILDVLGRYPALQARVYAAVRVGDRRWNLRISNGVDVKLPATGLEDAIDRLASMDAKDKLLDRDIVEVDLRRPSLVTVRVSDAVATAEAEAQKKNKRGGAT